MGFGFSLDGGEILQHVPQLEVLQHALLLGVGDDAADQRREERRVPRRLAVPLVLVEAVLKRARGR